MPRSKQPRRIKRRGRQGRGVADWSGPAPKHGPFGIFSNVRLFYIVGAAIMIGSVAVGGMSVCVRDGGTPATPTPMPTEAATAQVTPGAAETPVTIKQYPAAPPMTIDTAKSYSATIKTAKGDIEIELFAKDAPNTVNNFVFLARDHFYDGLPFHYVNPEHAVITGDPTNTQRGGPGYDIAKEDNERTRVFEKGTVGMINGSQFFIVLKPAKSMEEYWAFGKVTKGMEVVEQLAVGDLVTAVTITER